MTHALFERALHERARSPSATLVITAPADVIDPLAIARVATPNDPLLLWDAPALGDASYVGVGDAVRIDESGEGAIMAVRDRSRALFAAIDHRRAPGAEDAPAPALFGGIAFRPEPARTGAWRAFRDASFALPRWLYVRRGDRAYLQVAAAPEDAANIRASIDAAIGLLAKARAASSDLFDHEPAPCDVFMSEPSLDVWTRVVDRALAAIRSGALVKVVPAGAAELTTEGRWDLPPALASLRRSYPACARFAFQRGEATFLGASPERLVKQRGTLVETDALAGSARRGETAEDDARAIAALLASDKDHREHRVVEGAITGALASIGASVTTGQQRVRTLRNVHHLWTPITAVVRPETHVLDVVRALHPTPAVAGMPRGPALAWIAENELLPRGWYAGAVGAFDARGDGAFAVAIRSALVEGGRALLYAGGGVVEGSEPRAEHAEARIKRLPLMSALGAREPSPSRRRREEARA